MLERIAFAALLGGLIGYWLRTRQEPDIDWDEAGEVISLADIFGDLVESGELQPRNRGMIVQTVIEDCDCD